MKLAIAIAVAIGATLLLVLELWRRRRAGPTGCCGCGTPLAPGDDGICSQCWWNLQT